MIGYRIGIVAHNKRAAAAHNLMEATGAAFLSLDNGSKGCNGNHRHVLEWLSTSPTEWVVVLEDDAQPVDDFRTQLEAALTAAPCDIVSLYLGTNYPRLWQRGIQRATTRADQSDSPWLVSEHLLHAVGYCIRTTLVLDLLEALPEMPIDDAITTWARDQGRRIAYTWPSLVDHEDADTLISKRPTRNAPRKAHRTGTRTQWAGPTVELEYC